MSLGGCVKKCPLCISLLAASPTCPIKAAPGGSGETLLSNLRVGAGLWLLQTAEF